MHRYGGKLRDSIIRYTLVLLLAVSISGPRTQPLPVQAPNPAGRLEQVRGIRILHLQGSPYEMGLQQGALLRDPLRELVRNYLYERIVLERPASHFWLLAYARLLEGEVPRDLRREMQGIADGAGLSYQDVLLLNTVPDLLALTYRLPSWESFPLLFSSTKQSANLPQSTFCAAFAVWGRATLGGELIVGHNFGFDGAQLTGPGVAPFGQAQGRQPKDDAETDLLSQYLLVVVRRPSQGNAFVSLGLMGMVGVWAGMNEEKITTTLSSSPSVDVASSGQPLPFLLRQVLERAGDLTEAVNVILASRRLYGGNVIIGDGKAPEAIAIELSAHRHSIFKANTESGLLARTNHFLGPELALAQRDVLSEQERAASTARLNRLQSLLEFNSNWIGVEKGLTFLRDDYDARASSGRGSDQMVYGPYTLQSILFYPGRLTVWVANGNPMTPYTKLDLTLSLRRHR